MNKTSIEWSDYTINPFRFRNLATGKVGHHCDKISPGCKYCYSSMMQSGPYLSGLTFIEENKPKGEFFLDKGALGQVLRRRKSCRIFWCDMTDMFLADYPDEWIDHCFAVMALSQRPTHMVLTKRAERMRRYFASWKTPLCFPLPLPNVWLGVSVESQQYADERIQHLMGTPAAIRFLSCEPLLGPVDLDGWLGPNVLGSNDALRGIDWVIVGGESGPGARPMDLAWARSIVAQCKAAGVACFVKQLGKSYHDNGARVFPANHKGGDMSEWPEDLRIREWPASRRTA